MGRHAPGEGRGGVRETMGQYTPGEGRGGVSETMGQYTPGERRNGALGRQWGNTHLRRGEGALGRQWGDAPGETWGIALSSCHRQRTTKLISTPAHRDKCLLYKLPPSVYFMMEMMENHITPMYQYNT